jgi:phenylacetate-CoA ligase
LKHAHDQSRFHRERWGDRRPWEARELLSALAELPTTSKADVQSWYSDMLSTRSMGRLTIKTTGGSTGQTVTVAKNRAATAAEMAARWLGHGWFGVRIGDRGARFWGNPTTLKRKLRFAAADLAMNRIRFSAFAFDDHDLLRYWDKCLRFQPRYLYGYVSMLEAFGRFVLKAGYDGKRLNLNLIITTSEVLSGPQRDVLQRAFGAPVQNEYGCGEVGPIAYECERGQLHVMTENLVVEIVSKSGRAASPGEPGDIVLTDLNNLAMPLIRYRVGDVGVWGAPCECGRGFTVLQGVWGREFDFVQTPDGKKYHGAYFTYLFEDLRSAGIAVSKFRISQTDQNKVDVAIVNKDAATEQQVAAQVARALPGVQTTVRSVETIPLAASGKSVIVENTWLKQRPRSPA